MNRNRWLLYPYGSIADCTVAIGREKKWKAQTQAGGFFLLGAPPSRRQHVHENQSLGFGLDGAGETPALLSRKLLHQDSILVPPFFSWPIVYQAPFGCFECSPNSSVEFSRSACDTVFSFRLAKRVLGRVCPFGLHSVDILRQKRLSSSSPHSGRGGKEQGIKSPAGEEQSKN